MFYFNIGPRAKAPMQLKNPRALLPLLAGALAPPRARLLCLGSGFGGAPAKDTFKYSGRIRPGKQSPTRKVPATIPKPDYWLDGQPKKRGPMLPWQIEIKSAEDVIGMRRAGRVAREVLDIAGARLPAGRHQTPPRKHKLPPGHRNPCCRRPATSPFVTAADDDPNYKTKICSNPLGLTRAASLRPRPRLVPPPFTPSIHTPHAHTPFTPSVHTLNPHPPCTPSVHALHSLAGTALAAGITTDEIDALVHEASIARGAYPSPLNYCGFPKSCCTSINEVSVAWRRPQGIPRSTGHGDLGSGTWLSVTGSPIHTGHLPRDPRHDQAALR